MYVADADAIDDSLIPYTWYKDFVVDGARQHGLSEAYIANIEAVEARADPNYEREKEARKFLPC